MENGEEKVLCAHIFFLPWPLIATLTGGKCFAVGAAACWCAHWFYLSEMKKEPYLKWAKTSYHVIWALAQVMLSHSSIARASYPRCWFLFDFEEHIFTVNVLANVEFYIHIQCFRSATQSQKNASHHLIHRIVGDPVNVKYFFNAH